MWQQRVIVTAEPGGVGTTDEMAPDWQADRYPCIGTVTPDSRPLNSGSFGHQFALGTGAN